MAIRSGFFHAVKTGNLYDRVYNAEDHNLFLKGVIAQNGVYRYINGTLMPTSFREHVDAEINNEILTDRIEVAINPGKAMVNGYWFISDSQESVYLSPRPLGTGYRVDMITLRWNDGDRTISLEVTEGAQTNTKPSIISQDGPQYPQPLGYIIDPDASFAEKGYTQAQIAALKNSDGVYYNSDVYFEPVTDVETTDLVQEICLGYIVIPATVTNENISLYSMVGTTRCPYISFTAGPFDDSFVSQYNTEIAVWWDALREQGGIDPVLNIIEKKFVGNDDRSQSSTIMFTEFPGYTYNLADNINIYYNGLYVDEDEYEFVVDDQTHENVGIKIKNGYSYIPSNNSAVVKIFKAPTIDLLDGTLIKY